VDGPAVLARELEDLLGLGGERHEEATTLVRSKHCHPSIVRRDSPPHDTAIQAIVCLGLILLFALLSSVFSDHGRAIHHKAQKEGLKRVDILVKLNGDSGKALVVVLERMD
jgi:hypothetical protein